MEKIRRSIFRIIRRLEGGYYYEETSRSILKQYFNIDVGYSTAGFIDVEKIARGTVFGNYCGISENTYIYNANHPPRYFTTNALMFNPRFGCVNEDVLPRTKLIVGHDVWFGLSSIILPSVNNIGNGAIIAAAAVVTKNIEPYAIVGGNPARVIGYRFNQSVIRELEESKWWLLSRAELIKRRTEFEKIVGLSIYDLKNPESSKRGSSSSR
jgi:acetyltransferase-like isoleucine patch superfamily enzyme